MPHVPEQPDREQRILHEAVVDAYGEVERAMGWYYHLENRLSMPFEAICWSRRATSPLRPGEAVRVVALADEDDCMSQVHVLVKWRGVELAVPLGQLECRSKDESTCEAVEDWHYWLARGYCY